MPLSWDDVGIDEQPAVAPPRPPVGGIEDINQPAPPPLPPPQKALAWEDVGIDEPTFNQSAADAEAVQIKQAQQAQDQQRIGQVNIPSSAINVSDIENNIAKNPEAYPFPGFAPVKEAVTQAALSVPEMALKGLGKLTESVDLKTGQADPNIFTQMGEQVRFARGVKEKEFKKTNPNIVEQAVAGVGTIIAQSALGPAGLGAVISDAKTGAEEFADQKNKDGKPNVEGWQRDAYVGGQVLLAALGGKMASELGGIGGKMLGLEFKAALPALVEEAKHVAPTVFGMMAGDEILKRGLTVADNEEITPGYVISKLGRGALDTLLFSAAGVIKGKAFGYAQKNPEKAAELATKDKLSRADLSEMGIDEKTNINDRAEILKFLKDLPSAKPFETQQEAQAAHEKAYGVELPALPPEEKVLPQGEALAPTPPSFKAVPGIEHPFVRADVDSMSRMELNRTARELGIKSPSVIKADELRNRVFELKSKELTVPPEAAQIPPVEQPAPVEMTKTEALQQETAKSPEAQFVGSMGAGAIAKRTPLREDIVPSEIKAPREVIERRLNAAHGTPEVPLSEKIKNIAEDFWNKSTRAREHLPNNEKFASANESLRLFSTKPQSVADEVNRSVATIVDPMGPKQKAVFERLLVAKNMAESLKRGEPLRHGFESAKEVSDYVGKVQGIADQIPEVKEALRRREIVKSELLDQLSQAKLLPESANRNAYFHQQVFDRAMMEGLGRGRGIGKQKRSFQKERVKGKELGQEFDYNTDFVEAEAKWMTEAKMELAKKATRDQIEKDYDISKKLGKDDPIPLGYAEFHPDPGSVFYEANTIPEKVAEQIMKQGAGMVPMEELSKVLALGRKKTMVLPQELVNQLNSMKKSEASGALAKFAAGAQTAWKAHTLLNPKHALGYMARNFFGDIDPVIGGAPLATKFAPESTKELWDYYHKGNIAIPEAIKTARDLNVIGSAMSTADIPDVKNLEAFQRFYKSKSLLNPLTAVAKYYDTVRTYNEFRENILRLSAFKYYREQLQEGTLKNYGAAKKEVVDALVKTQGNDVAAAHLARNLMGDYPNITVTGQWLRKYAMPFWSWNEVNMTRYPRLVENAIKAGDIKGAGAAGAVYSAMLTARIATAYAAYYTWNKLMHPKEEEELSGKDQSSSHVILGKTDDGKTVLLRNTSALGDVAEWFGVEELLKLYPKYQSGQITGADLAGAMAKSSLNKGVQALRPDIKGVAEVLSGKSFYPDVTQPRTQDRGELAANVLGARDELKAARGLITGSGEKPRPNYLLRNLAGISDPKQNALSEIYELKKDYLRKEGKPEPQFEGRRTSFTGIKEAAQNNDYESFKKAYTEYRKDLKKASSLKHSIKNLDPIDVLSNADEYKFKEFLNGQQRERLKIARDFAHEMQQRIIEWIDKYHKEIK